MNFIQNYNIGNAIVEETIRQINFSKKKIQDIKSIVPETQKQLDERFCEICFNHATLFRKDVCRRIKPVMGFIAFCATGDPLAQSFPTSLFAFRL